MQPQVVTSDPPVIAFIAPNRGLMTLEGTNTFVVGERDVYVIDPGPIDDVYQDDLAAWLRSHRPPIQAVLLTHGHPDHAPGGVRLAETLGVPICAAQNLNVSYFPNAPCVAPFGAGAVFPADGDSLQVIPTPGHSADHVAFWLERDRILFSGDVILGRGTSVVAPPEGDMQAYMDTLATLRTLEPRLIAPGHGPLISDPLTRIDQYISHRLEREQQIVQELVSRPRTIPQLVTTLYADTDPRLHELAAGSVLGHLQKLQREGRVVEHDGAFTLANPSRGA